MRIRQQFFGEHHDLFCVVGIDHCIAEGAAAGFTGVAVGITEFIAGRDAEESHVDIQFAATRRTRDMALLKSFEAFREWVAIQAGFYTEHFYPDGSRGCRAKSIAFANMDETEFQQVYKSVLNVLWNWILFRKFSSPEQVENVAAQLLEFA